MYHSSKFPKELITPTLKKVCLQLENESYLPYKNISGGFSSTKIISYSKKRRTVRVELTSGVQNDVENSVDMEPFLINVDTGKFSEL